MSHLALRMASCGIAACLLCVACVTPAQRCDGPLEPINPPQHSGASQTPSAAEVDGSGR
jgi:hypothetical protein